ncbi:DNA repair protein XRCC1 isoform X2 [Danaus plexippus]|uniref:DNA repair protein XRCC1 isoform X2 n=1 Tax=Danaus plexippus TaxID=13037 RepID=UPI002AB2D5FD|nr:DNA repair protein XRCC1 isoform X2 [Danaus plexippus]
MPRVKIDYVVSMSSEDPENPANNLLSWEINKKKWLCKTGETSCSVVLQLTKAVQIESITIGTYHTSMLEVLVGSSEKPNETFEVLVPSCVLCSPREARGAPVERVKSFTRDELTSVRQRRWDRLRLVCSQPYNRHCKYGISFVHIFEPESPTLSGHTALSISRTFRLEELGSEDEEFRPGELFHKHKQDQKTHNNAQIRQATSRALNNIGDSSTRLTKTPISKTSNRPSDQSSNYSTREKRSLMYTEDDEQPHQKIDRVIERHGREKQREDGKKKTDQEAKKKKTGSKREESKGDEKNKETKHTDNRTQDQTHTTLMNSTKRKHSQEAPSRAPARPLSSLLSDVVFSISGYVNPRRASVRAAALRMGAHYTPDVTADCTHLICAFPNTPKLRLVRGSVAVVKAEWVEDCLRSGTRLKETTYDTRGGAGGRHQDSERTGDGGGGGRGRCSNGDSAETEHDTDDEIEQVMRRQKRKRLSEEEEEGGEEDRDVMCDTDEEDGEQRREEIDARKSLPTFLAGVTFSLCPELPVCERALLERYITAYGGVVLQCASEAPQYTISSSSASNPAWLWECHTRGRLLPLD